MATKDNGYSWLPAVIYKDIPIHNLTYLDCLISQHQNKAAAMAVLQSRLDQLEMARQAQMNAEHTESLTDISWGNQIRTYVLHPYRMVKDLRTNYEVSDPDSVLEGEIDGFILSFLSSSLDKDDASL
ncbi:hypothetical protein M5K25_011159 [Dendrobium thyrsiflorum]|uniref:Prokaryotic-type class I peptide chain release factors domain-containing protein n=1 Tax=Dendrobium thyrsiflorum TaxID=117978 RepID=A0ABD0V950_DENTH